MLKAPTGARLTDVVARSFNALPAFAKLGMRRRLTSRVTSYIHLAYRPGVPLVTHVWRA